MDKEKARLLQIIDCFQGKKIAVWGDFILDEYLYGNTRRISREAPVLIISYQKREFSLGGAGNSVLNLKALAADPLPVGVVGRDEPGQAIMRMLRWDKISTRYILTLQNYPTPLKTRILAGEENTRKQQILRIDKESRVPETPRLKKSLSDRLTDVQSRCAALLVSDYNYLTVQQDVFAGILPFFKRAKRPVTVDSRHRLLTFRGMTAATPNEPEVEEALQIKLDDRVALLKKAGRLLLRKLNSPALLITRGSRGMVLFEKANNPFFVPIHGSTDIVDVTGAGDTVISVFTLALACGASGREAALLANYAGGIVVMKKGTATVTAEELKEAIAS
ncbi:MAG: PfkB family carbohydrate kinase [Acidobacteriota bacterium]